MLGFAHLGPRTSSQVHSGARVAQFAPTGGESWTLVSWSFVEDLSAWFFVAQVLAQLASGGFEQVLCRFDSWDGLVYVLAARSARWI